MPAERIWSLYFALGIVLIFVFSTLPRSVSLPFSPEDAYIH